VEIFANQIVIKNWKKLTPLKNCIKKHKD
jgi:hypothetical protein